MAQVINSTDYLTFILTSYGLGRVGEALANPNEDLNISKIKVGDANFEYYEPNELQEDLVHPIPDGEFFIVEKDLLEDGLTVSFHAVFPEKFQNAEIREVGIYETVDGVDKLFAISTQQPLLKPYTSLNYLIDVDYYAFLKSANLAEVYDQIILNPDSQLVSKEDLENLMSTILFTENNLMDQVHDNTRVIGLNRVQQLQERMDKDRSDFGYLASYNNYTNVLNYVNNNSDVFGYWLFNYPRRLAPDASIIDIGVNGVNFSTNIAVNKYTRVFRGLMPMLSFSNGNYFYLPADGKFDIKKFKVIANGSTVTNPTVPFNQGGLSITTDGIASGFSGSNYLYSNFTSVTPTQSIILRAKGVYSSTPNAANGAHVLAQIVGTNSSPSIEASSSGIGAVRFHASGDTGITSAFISVSLQDGDIIEAEVIATSTSVTLNAKINGVAYTNTWSGNGLYCGAISATRASINNNYYWTGSIDLKESKLAIDGKTVFSGRTPELDFFNEDTEEDTPLTFAFAIEPLTENANRTLLARSNYSNSTHVFEINELANNSLEVKLFSGTNDYLTFTSEAGVIPNKQHSVLITYDPSLAEITAYVGAKKVALTKVETGTFTHLNRSTNLPMTSYVVDVNGNNAQYIDSNIGVASIIKKALTDEELRAFALTLEASMGNNPCIQTY